MAIVNEGIENDLLKATEQRIEAGLNPQAKLDTQRIVLAGMKVAIGGGVNGILRNLKSAPDPVKACAVGAVNLAFMLIKSDQTPPTDRVLAATVHASYLLMLQALDVAAKMGLVEITEGDGGTIDKATRMATNQIAMNMHLTPDKLNTAATKVHGVMKDPKKMQDIRLKIGVDRDPRAPEPTPLPEPQEAASEPA